jgi:hypothetical protein
VKFAGCCRAADTDAGGVWVVLAIVAAAVVVLGLVGGLLGWKYLRLDTLDDYRDGYAVGDRWRVEGETGECFRVMEAVYGPSARPEGWGAFVSGCRDGLAGREAASWYNLRSHTQASSS